MSRLLGLRPPEARLSTTCGTLRSRPHNILWSEEEDGAPGGIRTPDLLIRSPMPAEAAPFPYFVLNRAVRAARIGVRCPVSIELAFPMSLMPSPDAERVRCPRRP